MELTRNYIAERRAGDLDLDWGCYMSALLNTKGTLLEGWPLGYYGRASLMLGVLLREVRVGINRK